MGVDSLIFIMGIPLLFYSPSSTLRREERREWVVSEHGHVNENKETKDMYLKTGLSVGECIKRKKITPKVTFKSKTYRIFDKLFVIIF